MYVSYSTTATSFKVILSNRRRERRSSRRPPFTGAQSRHFSLETTAPPEKTKKQIFCQWQRVPGTSTGKKSPPLNRQLNIKLLSARGVRDGCVKRSGNTQRQQACFSSGISYSQGWCPKIHVSTFDTVLHVSMYPCRATTSAHL